MRCCLLLLGTDQELDLSTRLDYCSGSPSDSSVHMFRHQLEKLECLSAVETR